MTEIKTHREGLMVHEETEIADICMACFYKPVGGSCLVWRYTDPETCKAIKERMDKEKPSDVVPDSRPIFTNVFKILVKWNHETGEKKFRYVEVKSTCDINGFRILEKKKITRGEYVRRKDE